MPPVEIQRLIQAVEQFQARAPQNLPDGVMDRLKGVATELEGFDDRGDSPGQQEARKVAPGTDGTGEHYSKAARGSDGPSPGQREARSVSGDIAEAAKEIAERVRSGGGGAP